MNQGDLVTLKALPPRALDPLVSWRPWRFIDPSSEHADRLIDFMAERGVFFTPTLTLARAILKGDVPEVIEPPGIEKMPKTLRDWWKEFAYPSDYTREDFKQAKVELARQMVFVGRAQKGGVKVVAGSDTPNPFVLPGSSLHDELQLLVESGLTPMEALVAATGRASELLGQQNDLGTVAKGRYGDILILDGNPLENIQNIRRVRTVLKSGQVVYSTPGALSKTA
jgi:imidazolonepropionase-like amidohydrolase